MHINYIDKWKTPTDFVIYFYDSIRNQENFPYGSLAICEQDARGKEFYQQA